MASLTKPIGREPTILQGIRDQHGGLWIRYGVPDRHVLFSIFELQHDPSAVFTKLVGVGRKAFTTKAKNAFLEEIQAIITLT